MKIYKNLVNAVATVLDDIFNKKFYADKVIEKLFKQHKQWGSRDRRFVAEAVYDIVRNFRLYSMVTGNEKNFWYMTAIWMIEKQLVIPDWAEFKHVDAKKIYLQIQHYKKEPAIAESYPDWIWELCLRELGEEKWMKESKALNQQADIFIRVNTLKITQEKLKTLLHDEQIETEKVNGQPCAFKLKKRQNIFSSRYFKDGFFEIQDAGSQQISEFLNPNPGEFVIDACAGAGGKTLHLAALMNNKGKIVSMDVGERKLEGLRKRVRRAGAFNVEAKLIDSSSVKKFQNKADKLLLDVPCSGLGVIKRNPDTKWKLTKNNLEETKHLQQKILSDYSQMLKINGILVYSTCSILPSENEAQVKSFLKTNSNFQMIEEKFILPSEGFDGFYMAKLKRVE